MTMVPEHLDDLCLSESSQATLADTLNLASKLGHGKAQPEHLLLALFLTPGVPSFVLERSGLNAGDVWNDLAEGPAPTTGNGAASLALEPGHSDESLGPALADTLRDATARAQQAGHDTTEQKHLLRAVLEPSSGPGARLLRRLGAEVDELIETTDLFVHHSSISRDQQAATSPRDANRKARQLARQVALHCGASTSAAATLNEVLSDFEPWARRTGIFALGMLLGWVVITPIASFYRSLALGDMTASQMLPQVITVTAVNITLMALLVLWALPRLWRWLLVSQLREREADRDLPLAKRLRLAGELILLQRGDQAVDLLSKLAHILGVSLEPDEQLDATTAFGVSGPIRPRQRLAAWQRTRRATKRIHAAIHNQVDHAETSERP